MPKRSSTKRKQREAKWLEAQLDEDRGPSEGQFFVVDMKTGEKYPGLNIKQAKAKWREIGHAIYLSMDDFSPGRAPLRALFDAGQIP